MARVHRLQHVERFDTTNLTDNDSIRSHAQTVADQISLRKFSNAFAVGGTRFQPGNMPVLQDQFGRVFNRDHSLIIGNAG